MSVFNELSESFLSPPDIEALKSKKDVSGLVRALRYRRNKDVPRAAAEALGELHAREAVQPLLDLLTEYRSGSASKRRFDYFTDTRVAAAACTALGQIGDEQAILPLIDWIRDCPSDIHTAAENALRKFGTAALPAVVDALRDPGGKTIRMSAASILVDIDAPLVVPVLAARLGIEPDFDVRIHIVEMLRLRHDARSVPALRLALHDPYLAIRSSAKMTLEEIEQG